jgi:hypothetical protein
MVARDEARLQRAARWIQAEVGRAEMTLAPADLAAPGAADAVHARVAREVGEVDFLANNAGIGLSGRFSGSDPRAVADLLRINIVALTELTRLALDGMLARRAGRILNVASTAAFQPGPRMAVYYATKAFVVSFSEAVAAELAGTGVTVSTLCPGPTRTGFGRRAGMEGARVYRARVMDAASVADAGYRGLRSGKILIIPGLRNRLFALAARYGPRSLVIAVARRMNEER